MDLSPELQRQHDHFNLTQQGHSDSFAGAIFKRVQLQLINVENADVENGKYVTKKGSKATVVHTIKVSDDMLNPLGTLHGGCVAFLIDCCSTASAVALEQAPGNQMPFGGVSQDLSIRYIGPARNGETIRITSTTLKQSKTSAIIECRITNMKGELLAHGIHGKALIQNKPKL